jgi:calmodulin
MYNPASMSGMLGPGGLGGLGRNEMEIINVAFDAFKEDPQKYGPGEGKCTLKSLENAFKTIEAEGMTDDIRLLIDDIDENGDGEIDYEEFKAIMTKKFMGEDDDSSFVHTFEMLDQDKDGFIPAVELRHLLMKEGSNPLSEQEADELIMFADPDGDGVVDYRTFLRWLNNPLTDTST